MTWTKRERLAATIAGERPDRLPVALWRHFPGDDEYAESLASAHLAWQQAYDWDFVKVSPASSYCIRDWGVTDCWDGGPVGSRRYLRHAVTSPEQWAELTALDPQSGMLATQLDALRRIRAGLLDDTPILATIFSPLSQALNMAGPDRVLADLCRAPTLLCRGLETITASTLRFIAAAAAAGAGGIYFVVRPDEKERLTTDVYRQFGVPYDCRLLAAAASLPLNVVHLHGSGALFDEVVGYKAHVLNWHDRECGIDLRAGQARFRGTVSGGVSSWTLAGDSLDAVRDEARAALAASEGRRHVLGVGCMTLMSTPARNIRALRDFVEEPADTCRASG